MITVLVSLVFVCFPVSAGVSTPAQPAEQQYLDEKKTGETGRALDTLGEWTLTLDDPSLVELNLFRIRELMIYPELYDRGLEVLNRIRETGPACRFLRDRISIMTAWLLLKKGEVRSAEQAMAALSYLDFYMMGPCTSSRPGESGSSRCPGDEFDPGQICPGTYSGVTWTRVSPDRMGLVDIDSLNGPTAGSLYYLCREIRVEKDGDYYLILGKTGCIDLRVDGKTVFSDRTLHGFDHDQYFIPVRLAAGSHGLLITAGSSPDGIKVSLRIAETGEVAGSAQGTCCPPSLVSLVNSRGAAPIDLFRAGYLLVESRRPSTVNGAATDLLSRISESDPLYSEACFYLGRAGTDRDRAAAYYRKSIKTDPDNNEALRGLADIAMDRGLFYDAFPYISMMKKNGRAPELYDVSMARLFLRMGWTAEARRHVAALKRSRFPSAGLLVESGVFRSEGDLFHELLALERLMELDRYDRDLVMSRAAALEKTGNLDSAALLLHQATALFPNDTGIKLRLAAVVRHTRGAGPALPYLAAALNTAPENPALLAALGMTYLNLGKAGTAGHYLRMALQRDPGNSMIRLNLDLINGNPAGDPGK